MSQDRNFDGIAGKFRAQIYGTTKGKIRELILWEDLAPILATKPALTILDAGGGQGQLAIKLAKMGHQVTLVDLSEEMLDFAKEESKQQNTSIHFIQSSIQALPEQLNGYFDLILCHAVLEWVADKQSFLSHLSRLLKDDGRLSLMFYNRDALLFKMVTLGNFGYINTGLSKRKKKTLSPDYPCDPKLIENYLNELNLNLIQKTGIRVFHDYLMQKEKQINRFDELLELEKQYCRTEPFLSLARYIHLILKKN